MVNFLIQEMVLDVVWHPKEDIFRDTRCPIICPHLINGVIWRIIPPTQPFDQCCQRIKNILLKNKYPMLGYPTSLWNKQRCNVSEYNCTFFYFIYIYILHIFIAMCQSVNLYIYFLFHINLNEQIEIQEAISHL